jgi:HlyD family secretion protein
MSPIRILILLAVALALGGGVLWLSREPAAPAGLVSANGQIEARVIDIAADVGGRVAEIAVEEGDLVEPGDLLARIDTDVLAAQKLRAEAAVAAAESAAAAARAAVAQAEARLQLLRRELDRAETLSEREVISEDVLDTRRTDVRLAEAELEVARANLSAQERAVEAERATVAEIETRIADGALHAPRFARVLYRLAEPGEVVAQGRPVVTLVSVAELYMDVFLPGTDAPLVRIGDEARIVIDVMPDIAIPARVTFISPQAQFTPRQVETREERDSLMFRVRVAIPEPLARARIEMVKTGVRGVAWLRLARPGAAPPDWPAELVPPESLREMLSAAEAAEG